MAKKPTERARIPVDLSVLDDETRRALDAEAEKSIASEMEQDARDKYFADAIARKRRKHVPAEQRMDVTIEAAPYVPFFMIDGEQFFVGSTYNVTTGQAAVLHEQMQRSWQHQEETSGQRNSNSYRRSANLRVGMQHAGTPTRGFAGNVIAVE